MRRLAGAASSRAKQKAAGIFALRLAGFKNLVFMKTYPAPGERSQVSIGAQICKPNDTFFGLLPLAWNRNHADWFAA